MRSPRGEDVGDGPPLRGVERALRLAVALGHALEREANEGSRARLPLGGRAVPQREDELAPLRDVRRRTGIGIGSASCRGDVDAEPVLGATEEVRELGARLRGREVLLVLLARQGQDAATPMPRRKATRAPRRSAPSASEDSRRSGVFG